MELSFLLHKLCQI